MAKTLKLNWGTVNLDLVTDSALSVMSWTPQVAMPRMNGEPGPVIESLTVRVSGATHDALSTNLQSLHQMQAWAKSYIEDHAGTTPVWLHAKLTNETGERRALVRAIDAQFISPWYGPMADNNPATMLALAIERDPYWEGTAAGSACQGSAPAAAAAVVYDYTGGSAVDIVGDAGARLGRLAIYDAGGAVGRLWVGLRSSAKHGTLDNFVPIWECEDADATLGTDAARATDTTASPGGTANTKVTVTPGTTGWANRLTIQLQNITSNEVDNWGRYLWLLRSKLTAGTWDAQLRYGFNLMGSADLVQGPIVRLTNTDWDYAEMGVGDMPYLDPWTPDSSPRSDSSNASIHVFARRVAGAGNLHLDCLCPIPIDEGFLKVGAFNSAGPVEFNESQFARFHSPRDVIYRAAGTAYETPPVMENNFVLPPGDGRMIIVYARNAISTLTDDIEIMGTVGTQPSGQYYPRWASLRGGE